MGRTTENRRMPATTAAASTMGQLSPLEVGAWIGQSVLSMIGTPGFAWGDLDGVGAHDADDHDLGPRGQWFFRCDGLIFHGSILYVQVYLARAGPLARHGEVYGPGLADRALDAHIAFGLKPR